jgi:hypothetical protein
VEIGRNGPGILGVKRFLAIVTTTSDSCARKGARAKKKEVAGSVLFISLKSDINFLKENIWQ